MRKPTDAAGDAAGRSGGGAKSTPCCSKVGLKRGPWTPEEDEVLANYIRREGEGRWRTLPKRAGLLRCGKSCRLRWMNYLRPCVKRGQIAPDEEDLILRLHRLLGNRWSLIAGRIPGRTDNEIKNYWNTHLSKKLISQGIDPRTHKPLDADVQPPKSKQSSTPPPNPNYEPQSNSGVAALGLDPVGSLEEEEDKYCTEDVFSTFLNSLINEDLYTCTQNQHPHYDAFASAGWDAPLMSPAATTTSASASALHHNPPQSSSPASRQRNPDAEHRKWFSDNLDSLSI